METLEVGTVTQTIEDQIVQKRTAIAQETAKVAAARQRVREVQQRLEAAKQGEQWTEYEGLERDLRLAVGDAAVAEQSEVLENLQIEVLDLLESQRALTLAAYRPIALAVMEAAEALQRAYAAELAFLRGKTRGLKQSTDALPDVGTLRVNELGNWLRAARRRFDSVFRK